MAINIIPLSQLQTQLEKTLYECADSGKTVVVEMPDQRLIAIQPLEPQEDDTLIDELLASDPKFQAMVEKSKASPRKPFALSRQETDAPEARVAGLHKGAIETSDDFDEPLSDGFWLGTA